MYWLRMQIARPSFSFAVPADRFVASGSDLLTVGMVNDIFVENANDDCDYATLA